ncbi:MAG: MATE family efflux transporter [Bacteroidales bacterium]|nr:MATE family efflux transporter [Bacteroidales bacterium]MBN2817380.1 MATE family efflux transporter [Bacteroidales bacterium]
MNNFFTELKDSIFGVEQDYTKIRLRKAIVLLSIPMVLEMLFESLFAILDIYFVSQLGDNATAVVGLTESLMTLVYAIGIGIAMGTTGLVSRRIGEKNPEKASRGASQAILLSLFLSLFIAIPGFFAAEKILGLMKASPEVIEQGRNYTRLMMTGNILIMLLFVNNAIFRSAGNPALSMWVLIIANLVNIVLDPCFIFGLGPFPELGVTGAAVATNTGRGLAVLIQFYLMFKGKGRIKLRLSYFRLQIKTMWKVLYLSGGGIFQFLIATSSWIFLYRILSSYQEEVIAGYTIGIRIFVFFLLPAWGLSNAASTLVGQNLGAKNPERAQKAVWITALVNACYMLLIMLLFQFIPHILISAFGTSEVSYDVAIRCLKIISLGNLFYGVQMVIGQAFNGAGDTYTPTLLNFIGFWLIEIPLAALLALKLGMEENGVFYSIFIAESVLCIISVYVFTRGKWKLREI